MLCRLLEYHSKHETIDKSVFQIIWGAKFVFYHISTCVSIWKQIPLVNSHKNNSKVWIDSGLVYIVTYLVKQSTAVATQSYNVTFFITIFKFVELNHALVRVHEY